MGARPGAGQDESHPAPPQRPPSTGSHTPPPCAARLSLSRTVHLRRRALAEAAAVEATAAAPAPKASTTPCRAAPARGATAEAAAAPAPCCPRAKAAA